MQESPSPMPTPMKGEAPVVISTRGGPGGGRGGALAQTGPRTMGGLEFLGTPAQADDIVYVIDKSGSMLAEGAFDQLRLKLAESIGGLDPSQRFHVIFFGEKKEPLELDARRLMPATPEHKLAVAQFLDKIAPTGQTLVLPALERAFAVCRAAKDERSKLVCLLSDGGFEGFIGGTNEYKGKTGNKAVLAWLDDNNEKTEERDLHGDLVPRRKIQVYTFLYRGDDPEAVKVMKEIASQHNGLFTHVGKDE